MTPFQEKEKTFILLTDIAKCFVRHWGKILLIMALVLSLGLWVALNQKVKFKVLGRFKEARGESVPTGHFVQNLLNQVGIASSSTQSCHILKSLHLLSKVVEELGLQVTVSMETGWERSKRTMRENWDAERRLLLKDLDTFVFRNVKYEKEASKKYLLYFHTPKLFEIRDLCQAVIAQGELGRPLSFDEVTLTIEKTPESLKLQQAYPLSIVAAMTVLGSLSNELEIDMNLKDSTIYELCLPYRDRKLAIKIVNGLMKAYQEYLKEETDRMGFEQIAYLEKRKEELCLKMDEYLKDHVVYLKENLGTKGFLNLNQHLQHLSSRKQKCMDQQALIDTEMVRLDDWDGQSNLTLSGDLGGLQREKYDFRKQRDTLNLAFAFRKKKKMRRFYPPYAPREKMLFTYQDKLDQIDIQEKKLALAEEGDHWAIASLFPSLFASLTTCSERRLKTAFQTHAFENLSSGSAIQLKTIRQTKAVLEKELQAATHSDVKLACQIEGVEREDYVAYLEHQLRLASLQENILKERLFYPMQGQEAFQGIDLTTARALYHDYIQGRDEQEAKIRQLNFSKAHLEDPDFEFISLVQVLPDGISQQLARSMGEMVQSMRDTRNLSERDIERMERHLKRDQVNLKRHIDQTVELCRLQISLIEDKVATIQSIILDLLNQEISLLDQQIEDRMKQQKKALQLERKLIENQLEEIESELVMIPDQWFKEHQLAFNSEMNMNMLESMVRMVESKNIEHNLIQVQSKPIDFAYSLLNPMPPHIKLFALGGSFIGLMMGFGIALAIDFSKGFPLTLKNLQLQGRKVCGKFKRKKIYPHLNEMSGQNLQILRTLSESIPKNQSGCVVSLLSGNGSDYSRPLGELLAKEEKKVLCLTFDSATKDVDGLSAYLNGKEKNVTIKNRGMIDVISVGHKNHFSIELLKRPLFQQFLAERKREYDVILLRTSFYPGTPEGRFFMTISDCLFLTLETESNESLSPYYAWEREGKILVFVGN